LYLPGGFGSRYPVVMVASKRKKIVSRDRISADVVVLTTAGVTDRSNKSPSQEASVRFAFSSLVLGSRPAVVYISYFRQPIAADDLLLAHASHGALIGVGGATCTCKFGPGGAHLGVCGASRTRQLRAGLGSGDPPVWGSSRSFASLTRVWQCVQLDNVLASGAARSYPYLTQVKCQTWAPCQSLGSFTRATEVILQDRLQGPLHRKPVADGPSSFPLTRGHRYYIFHGSPTTTMGPLPTTSPGTGSESSTPALKRSRVVVSQSKGGCVTCKYGSPLFHPSPTSTDQMQDTPGQV
jgi:hypothetical protein